MAVKKTEDVCIIKCNPHRELAVGYTKVKIMPENYSKIAILAGATGKTLQDVVDELLSFAISKTKIQQEDGNLTVFNL